MKIIGDKIKRLEADEGYLLKEIKDNGHYEGDVFIPPYTTKVIYLGIQIQTLEQAKEIYEEIEDDKED